MKFSDACSDYIKTFCFSHANVDFFSNIYSVRCTLVLRSRREKLIRRSVVPHAYKISFKVIEKVVKTYYT